MRGNRALYLLMRRPPHFPHLVLALLDAVRLRPSIRQKRGQTQWQNQVLPAHIRRFRRGF